MSKENTKATPNVNKTLEKHQGKLFTMSWGKQEARKLKSGADIITDTGQRVIGRHTDGTAILIDASKYVMAMVLPNGKFQPVNLKSIAPLPKKKLASELLKVVA
jgi:hypothetical protein